MENIKALIGKDVRHADGRIGSVVAERLGRDRISVDLLDNYGRISSVHLNSEEPDSGATGWSWKLSEPGERDQWIELGDHRHCFA